MVFRGLEHLEGKEEIGQTSYALILLGVSHSALSPGPQLL